jgi:hypothetical protein
MRPFFSFLTVSLVLVLGRLQPSLAVPHPSENASVPKLKESISPPLNWIDLGRPSPVGLITLRVALPQARFSELERQLYEISDPQHARYGQHLLKEQVEELVRPKRSSVEAVDAWLAEHGIPEGESIQRSRAGDWVTIRVPIAQAEKMLDTVSPSAHPFLPAIPGFSLYSQLHRPLCLRMTRRSSTFGSMPSMATCSSARRTTAFPSTCTSTSN